MGDDVKSQLTECQKTPKTKPGNKFCIDGDLLSLLSFMSYSCK